MEFERAEEIMRSSDNIKVLYNNSPVWIESIKPEDQTAHVRVLNTNGHVDVPVTALAEKNNAQAT